MGSYNALEEYNKRKKQNGSYNALEEFNKRRAQEFASTLEKRLNEIDTKNQEVFSSYKSRFFDEEGNPLENSVYKTDTGNALNQYSSFKNWYDTESSDILNSLDKYGKYLDGEFVSSVKDAFGKSTEAHTGILSAYEGDHSYWSQFGNEKEYKQHLEDQKEYQAMLDTDLDKLKSEIEEMERLQKYWDTYDIVRSDAIDKQGYIIAQRTSELIKSGWKREDAEAAAQYEFMKKYPEEFEMIHNRVPLEEVLENEKTYSADAIADKRAKYNTIKEIQEKHAIESKALAAADFAEKSSYSKGRFTGDNDYDRLYEYINASESRSEELEGPQTAEEYLLRPFVEGDGTLIDAAHAAQMNENEVAIFNYYYATGGKETAVKY